MPCYKFVATLGDRQAARKMVRTGFSGFYLAVNVPGSIAAGESFELHPGPREMTLTRLFRPATSSL
jgi:MOSC domain-containing protein YiiM